MTESAQALEALPGSLPVAVLLERRAASNPWVEYVWRASGIADGSSFGGGVAGALCGSGAASWVDCGAALGAAARGRSNSGR